MSFAFYNVSSVEFSGKIFLKKRFSPNPFQKLYMDKLSKNCLDFLFNLSISINFSV